MKRAILAIIVIVLIGGGWAIVRSDRFASWRADQAKKNLPPAERAESIAANITQPLINALENRNQTITPELTELPAEKNLAVPFTVQAPHAKWDEEHGEFCEEASSLMVGRFFQNRGILSADDAEAALQQIKDWEVEHFGKHLDTDAEETARIIKEFYELKVDIVRSPTVDQIKRAIAAGHPVIVPASGRELGNPNFRQPGPIYHMLVVKGYTKDNKFITNDPGTRKGADYVYDQSVIMNANHDWNDGQVSLGEKVVLIVSAS